MTNLIDCLNTETIDNLKKRLTALSFSGTKNLKKPELVNLIDKLFQVDNLKIYWNKLENIDKKAISEVVFCPGATFDSAQFFAKYQKYPSFSHPKKDHYDYRQASTLLGAFFFHKSIPYDLQERFKNFIERPEESVLTGIDNLPEMVGLKIKNMEITALAEVKAILKLIHEQKIKVSDKTKYPSASSIQAVENVLYDGDFYTEENRKPIDRYSQEIGAIRAFAWLMLIQSGKLANLSGNTLQLTPAGRNAMILPSEEVLKKLWSAWLISNLLDEFRRIDVIKGQIGKGKRDFSNPSSRREVIEAMLYDSPTHTWIKFNEFSRFMLSNHATFDVTECDPWRLYICEQQYGSLGYNGFHGWHIMQERYMLCFLFEYAATLGLIDVAYIPPHDAKRDYSDLWGTDDLSFLSRYDGLVYFRINNLGRFCLNLDDTYQTTQLMMSNINIEVNEQGIIKVSSSSIPSDVVIMLEKFCKRKDSHIWILDQDSLVSAVETRHELSDLYEFFSKHSVTLPKNIEALIKDTETKSQQIAVKGRVVLFECKKSDIANYFSRESTINRYCSLVGEKLLAVPEEKLSKFRSLIKKLGYVVHV